MTTAKVDIRIGALSFAGEGDKEWLAKQLDKLIQHAPALLQIAPEESADKGDGEGAHRRTPHAGKAGTLASYLASKSAKNKDAKKFLATAAWLHLKGQARVTSAEVNKALDENSQGKVSNPALVLRRHVSKGSCEKSGEKFYVTDEGRQSLG